VGVREPGGQAPIGAADLFRYASMAKPVAPVAALVRVEEGRIGLGDPLDKHLPQFSSCAWSGLAAMSGLRTACRRSAN
jgi:CubicO group peptidase (beta-lactamase class C family)